MLVRRELRYFLSVDVIGVLRTRLYFLTDIVLRVPVMGVRYFDFLEKGEAKSFPEVASLRLQTRRPYYS